MDRSLEGARIPLDSTVFDLADLVCGLSLQLAMDRAIPANLACVSPPAVVSALGGGLVAAIPPALLP